ncbi:MAG: hypothetical protein OEW00_02800 [candidate division Zixibacteria bacterium]|nr:hypothetical protein [candidate division Zixibacteria bacterium]
MKAVILIILAAMTFTLVGCERDGGMQPNLESAKAEIRGHDSPAQPASVSLEAFSADVFVTCDVCKIWYIGDIKMVWVTVRYISTGAPVNAAAVSLKIKRSGNGIIAAYGPAYSDPSGRVLFLVDVDGASLSPGLYELYAIATIGETEVPSDEYPVSINNVPEGTVNVGLDVPEIWHVGDMVSMRVFVWVQKNDGTWSSVQCAEVGLRIGRDGDVYTTLLGPDYTDILGYAWFDLRVVGDKLTSGKYRVSAFARVGDILTTSYDSYFWIEEAVPVQPNIHPKKKPAARKAKKPTPRTKK